MTEIQRIAPERLRTFLRPGSIALIGATDNSRWSLCTFENLQRFEFPGPIYLVNPNREIVHGQKAFKSLRNLPEPADLAFVMVSTTHVLSVIEEAAELGTRQFVVLTSGFSEVGPSGVQLEQELLALARERDLLILGPNGNGFINVTDQITPYGLPISPPLIRGPVGVVLQSGALASAVLAFAQAHAIGLSLLVSMGNESMLSVTDVVDYLLDDENTRSIALFLESIRHPAELSRIARKARERQKLIVALKIGTSEVSARTALAHTGALVGNDAINDAAFRQLGIVRVHSLEDLLITAGLAGYNGALPGRRMGVVTPSGGACDIISDLADENGLELPAFAPETIKGLQAVLPPFSTAHNPLDVTGYIVVDGTLQIRALDVVTRDPNIDFILNLVSIDGSRTLTPEALATTFESYRLLAGLIQKSPLPVVLVSNTCLDLSTTSRAVVERTGLHFVAGMTHGVQAINQVLWWSEMLRNAPTDEPGEPTEMLLELDYPQSGTWSELQGRRLLEATGIPIVPGVLAESEEEAVEAARLAGLPVALKIQSAALPHKSDIGGVALNLRSMEEVRQSYTSMLAKVRTARPDAELEGILVSPMRPTGIELLVGVVRDPLWGLVLTIGLGGIWTEALKDTSVRVLPVTSSEIVTMFDELRGAALFKGARGHAPVDLQALSEIIYRVSQLANALGPRLMALEINPLRVDPSGIEALDVLVSFSDE